MTNAIAWKKPNGSLGVIDFDATISEQHTLSVNVTSHPIETGATMTDHIRPNPDSLTLDFFITNTPISILGAKVEGKRYPKIGMEKVVDSPVGKLASVIPGGLIPFGGLLFSKTFDRVSAVYEALAKLVKAGTLVTVYTSIRKYENFVILSVSAPKTAQSGNALTFSVQIQEIRIVSTETTGEIPVPDNTRDKPKKPAGPKATDAVPETVKGSALDALTGLGKVAA